MGKLKPIFATLFIVAIVIGLVVDWRSPESPTRTLWQQAVVPGALSQPHAFLANNCAACHVPVTGIEPTRCIACHANNADLLQRQATAFHAQIRTCSGCHVEHQGTTRMPTTMDHALLARIAYGEIRATQLGPREIEAAMRQETRTAPLLTSPAMRSSLNGGQSMLTCASCHQTKDRHRGQLGTDCVQCHATDQWTVAEFRHPSPRSTDCAQCHLPPPSHAMEHFSMVSARIARQPSAQVNQCQLCHQTTAWNDIKGVGWAKHH